MSPEQSEGVFGAHGWAGDRGRAWAAGPMTERTSGLVPERSRGTKHTMPFEDY